MRKKVVLKCSSKTNGGPFVTTTGAPTMPEWSAGSWDCQLRELKLSLMLILVGEKDRLCWTTFSVVDEKHTSLTALTMAYIFTTVDIMRMLVLGAKVSKV